MKTVFLDPGKIELVLNKQVVDEYLRDLKRERRSEPEYGPLLCQHLRTLVQDLKEQDRKLLNYKFEKSLSDEEIAWLMKVSVTKVRRDLQRIYRALRKRIVRLLEDRLR